MQTLQQAIAIQTALLTTLVVHDYANCPHCENKMTSTMHDTCPNCR